MVPLVVRQLYRTIFGKADAVHLFPVKQSIYKVLCLNICHQLKFDSNFVWLACNLLSKSTTNFRLKQLLICGDIGARVVTSYAFRNKSIPSLPVINANWSVWRWTDLGERKPNHKSQRISPKRFLDMVKKNEMPHYLTQNISDQTFLPPYAPRPWSNAINACSSINETFQESFFKKFRASVSVHFWIWEICSYQSIIKRYWVESSLSYVLHSELSQVALSRQFE